MGWSRLGRLAIRSKTLLKKRISTKAWISSAIRRRWCREGHYLGHPSPWKCWICSMQQVACRLGESTAMQTVDWEGGCRAHLLQDRGGSLPDFLWIYTNVTQKWSSRTQKRNVVRHLRLIDFYRNARCPSKAETIQATQKHFKHGILSNAILRLFPKQFRHTTLCRHISTISASTCYLAVDRWTIAA